jgi:hypothetical protein
MELRKQMEPLRASMTVYFVTRFSICDSQFRGFRLTADYADDEYERKLFSFKRLDHKFKTFETVTLSSVLRQTCDNWKWLIYTSERLPKEYMDRLLGLIGHNSRVEVAAVKDFAEFFERHKTYDFGESFATVRLDDDDGLDSSFVAKVQGYSQEVGSIVNFTEGCFVTPNDGRMVVGEKISERNTALGLTGIGLRIYLTGSHTDIHTRYNVIYDDSPEMFYLCCSPFTDTQRGFTPTGRLISKFRRLLFLTSHRPSEARREFFRFFRKRLSRLPH